MTNQAVEIQKIEVSMMGTVNVTAKIKPMRKAEKFSVYPVNENSGTTYITLQSDKRLVKIRAEFGTGYITKAANYPNAATPKAANFLLTADQREALCEAIRATSAKECGSIIVTDNGLAHLIGLEA